jgi:hypothetical protein
MLIRSTGILGAHRQQNAREFSRAFHIAAFDRQLVFDFSVH